MPKRLLRSALNKLWTALIFRDHWQGEFFVCTCGAIGWGILALTDPDGSGPLYGLMFRLLPERFWAILFIGFGSLQLVGLTHRQPWPRILGALGVCTLMSCVFYSLLLTDPWSRSLSVYLGCTLIEAAASVYQTANVVRSNRWWPRWIFRP